MTLSTSQPSTESTSAAVPDAWVLLRCPACKTGLAWEGDQARCLNAFCGAKYPVLRGVPILIHEPTSLCSIDSIRADFAASTSRKRPLFSRLLPGLTWNLKAADNYRQLLARLPRGQRRPKVLVIGGRLAGAGTQVLFADPGVDLIESDVAGGPRTALVCDAHDLPFPDASLDAVVIQAVLNVLVDPHRAVQEIHRVLRDGGLVYAETSFMQPVLDGRFDFTRFTHLGHRRLFRYFDEIGSGPVAGTGTALAVVYRAFLMSFVTQRRLRAMLGAAARLSAFWLKYLDKYLIHQPGAYDAAMGYYFLGQKTDHPLPDSDLIRLYHGAEQ